MRSFPILIAAAGCALSLLACAGDGDRGGAGAAGSGSAAAGHGGTAGSASTTGGRGGGAAGNAGTTGGSGTRGGATGTAGRGNGGSTGGSSGSSGGAAGAGAWDCLDVPGTLCICYARAGTDAPNCSAGFRCCFQLNATSCECFVAEEDCTSAAAQYTPVATCPPL